MRTFSVRILLAFAACGLLLATPVRAQSVAQTRHWNGQGLAPVYEGFDINPDGTFNMMPAAAATCAKALKPKIVYLYHFDQDYAARATNPRATPQGLPGGLTIAQSLDAFENALKGSGIEFRRGNWYPAR